MSVHRWGHGSAYHSAQTQRRHVLRTSSHACIACPGDSNVCGPPRAASGAVLKPMHLLEDVSESVCIPSVEHPAGAVMTGNVTEVGSWWVMSTVSNMFCRSVRAPAHEAAGSSNSRAAQRPQVTIPISCYRERCGSLRPGPNGIKHTGRAAPTSGDPATHPPREWCVRLRRHNASTCA